MAQKKYQVELPDGSKYEIEEPSQETSTLKEFGSGLIREPVDIAKDVGGAIAHGGLPNPAESMGGALGGIVGRTLKEKGTSGVMRALMGENPLMIAADTVKGMGKELSQLDPTGISQALGHQNESTAKRAGRATFDAATAIIPSVLGGGRLAKIGRAAKVAEEAAATAKAAEELQTLKAGTTTGAYPQRPAVIRPAELPTSLSMPVKPSPAQTGSASTMAGMATDNPLGVQSVRGGSVTGPKISMNVLSKPKAKPPTKAAVKPPVEVAPAAEVPSGRAAVAADVGPAVEAHNPNNPAMVVEAQADALGNRRLGGGKNYTGPERRMSSESLAAMEEELTQSAGMTRVEDEARLAAQQADRLKPAEAAQSVPTGPDIAPPSLPLDKLGEALGPTGKGKVIRVGYDKPLGEPPAAPPNALKAGKVQGPSPEVQARLEAGESLEKVAADLRDKHGSKVAAKMMGQTPEQVKALSGGGPSKIPANAVDKIKESLGPKIEAGKATPQEQALWDRIKSERGAADIKKLLIAGGAVGGGLIGAGTYTGDDHTSDQALMRTALGVLAGAALPAAILHPHHILTTRTEGFLSGLAIPKNILTDVSAPITAALENTSTKGRMAPIKEMFRVPENTKNFLHSMKNPAQTNKYGKIAGPFSRTIGALDTTGAKILERGGVPEAERHRLLLTENRSLFGGWKPNSRMKAVLDVAYPFQRVPTNVAAETADALGRVSGVRTGPNGVEFGKPGLFGGGEKMKAALDILSTGGGAALGEWAKGDKKKLAIAQMLMAAFGPRAGLGTLGMASQVGRQAIGGISPIPEQNADIPSFIGWPPTGYKTAKKLFGGS